MRRACVAAILVSMATSCPISADQAGSQTLVAALGQAGFPVPASLPAADRNRMVERRQWDHDSTHFVAAIDVDDRGVDGNESVHALRISKSGTLDRLRVVDALGGAGWVSLTPRYTFITTHLSPSAEYTLVLDSSFSLIGRLKGYGIEVQADGTILFPGNMVHFADNHQQTVQAFNPVSRKTTEVFPGTYTSSYGPAVMKHINALLARSDESTRDVLVAEKVDVGFDRDLNWRADGAGRKVAISVSYYRDRLLHLEWETTDNTGRPMPLVLSEFAFRTIAVCSRAGADAWDCREELLADVAKRHKVRPPADNTREAVDQLLALVLAEQ